MSTHVRASIYRVYRTTSASNKYVYIDDTPVELADEIEHNKSKVSKGAKKP